VISYQAARDSQHPLAAGRQQITRQWWRVAKRDFDLYSSELVRQEVSRGDTAEAQKRLKLLKDLTELVISSDANQLAKDLVKARALPTQAMDDADHIAIAATTGMKFLVSWNFRHILNSLKRNDIESVILARGFHPLVLCTPEQLLAGE
jgi:hypothetical protein